MNIRILLLAILFCTAAVPAVTASGNYLGGEIVLGGSGPQVTQQATLAITEAATVKVPVATQPPTGSISVTTSPAGASVVIDGTLSGISPATISGLTPGSHTLLLRLNGYDEKTTTVTIVAGQTLVYTGTLSASSEPASVPASKPAASQTTKKSPGFEVIPVIAALGAVFAAMKFSR